jgi:16S rRNA (cytosine1402-N4)-methyltransferase
MLLLESMLGARHRKGKTLVKTDAQPADFHEPVLLREVVELLAPAPGKVFVDGTLGGGGHSEAFLQAGARVIGLDQDPEALAFAAVRLARFSENFCAIHANFAHLDQLPDVPEIDAALLDLGVSSWQLDTPKRGFSFMKEGPLDMRMNPSGSTTAADLLHGASVEELERIFREFGDEPAARRIALRIVHERTEKRLETTLDLARLVENTVPRRGKTHPATRVFQALRIAVNRELETLAEALEKFTTRLRSGGRFGVITFHSLEDRMVKAFFKQRSVEFLDRPEWPAPRRNPNFMLKLVTRKAVVASQEEQTRNPRSRSAKLRVAEKI